MYVTAGKVSEFVEGEIYQFDVGGWPIDVTQVGGRFYAFGDACPHWGVSLASGHGYVTPRRSVICLYHESAYDLATGRPFDGPAHEYLPIYSVPVEGEDVIVGWDDEEASAAEEAPQS